MTTTTMSEDDEVVVECGLDAALERVWRALTVPELAADWLDAAPGLEGLRGQKQGRSFEIVEAKPFTRLTYRWREAVDDAPEESLVTIELSPDGPQNTWFRLTHRPPSAKRLAANGNNPPMALAA